MESSQAQTADSELASLQAELEACSEIKVGYKRLDCEKPVKKAIELYEYKTNAEKFAIGPINYYWYGLGSEGNEDLAIIVTDMSRLDLEANRFFRTNDKKVSKITFWCGNFLTRRSCQTFFLTRRSCQNVNLNETDDFFVGRKK